MGEIEFKIDDVHFRLGMIINKHEFRYNIEAQVCLYKTIDAPMIYFRLALNENQRIELHPTSIEEIIQIEDQYIYYLKLQRRPSASRKESNSRNFWNSDVLEIENEDEFVKLILPHFTIIRLEFSYNPTFFIKYVNSMKLSIHLGFYNDIVASKYPLNITKRLWLLPWNVKYSIFILLTNRKMTIDDLTNENIKIFIEIPNSDKILENIFWSNKMFSLEVFSNTALRPPNEGELPPGHISVRKIQISPGAIVFFPHEIDLGNRVVRDKDCDDFIRANFVDDYNERNIWSRCNTVLTRFKNLLKGFCLLGKYYEFLGFSNSQMRNHSCWMIHCSKKINADDVRKTLGDFEKCKTVCKYASRMGLCFSGTYGGVDIDFSRINLIDDITSGKYTFSDGVGMISPDLFEQSLQKLHVKENQIITALQVRIGGCKGVLTLMPEINNSIYVRNSMNKFDSDHYRLEICSYAASHPGFLNRQIILILNSLGIGDEVFLNLQKNMIEELRMTLNSELAAEQNLRKTYPSYYKDLIYMLNNGMKLNQDAYLDGMISAIFLASVKLIKSKARILAPRSRLLMGVLDEYRVLNYGEVFIQINEDESTELIEGRVAIVKNPCYHPGDIRVLKAVYRKELSHLYNVVVFPQQGPRPHPNECSGSDLDGDLYFVTWNPALTPDYHVEPMDYDSPAEKPENDIKDIGKVIDFFTTFMQSENIGRISNAHLVWADKKGVQSPEAIQLALLTSVSVDFPKTGIAAEMPQGLKIQTWPDFMEKTGKSSYESKGIIGKLWRSCTLDTLDIVREHKVNMRFVVAGHEAYLPFAKTMYTIYSSKMKKLIKQYDCENEFFVLTAQTGEKSKKRMRYDDGQQIQTSISHYKEEVHKMFRNKTLNLVERRKIASACYVHTYSKRPTYKEKIICLSFPWIFYDYLL